MAENDGKVMERAERFFSETARFSAGAKYCGALIDLDFDPEIVSWIYISSEDRIELAIVTSMVDRIRPLAIYEMLFKAYDAAALPGAIDPFEVSLYSPNTRMGVNLFNGLKLTTNDMASTGIGKSTIHGSEVWISIGATSRVIVPTAGVYRVMHTVRNADQDHARWQGFKSNVKALAPEYRTHLTGYRPRI